jgi:hypothetical protein
MKSPKTILMLFFLLFPFLFFTSESPYDEDSVPRVSNVQAAIIDSINAVRITYDLFDAESDPMKVTLRISDDSGKTYLYPCDSVSGDVGYPVNSGNQKEIYWYYSTPPIESLLKAKVIANDLHPVLIQRLVNRVDSNKLFENMQFIEGIRHRTAGPQHLQEVKDSIYNRFLRYELQTTIQNFDYNGYNAQNFQGRLPGTTQEDTTYIVDGHYETVSISPGADDNGSAVAAFLEIARILSKYNFRNTIKFIGFDLEESGLVGSIRYVSEGIPSYEKIAGVFNFEMIGYYCDEPNCQSIPSGFCTLFPAVCDSIAAQQYKGNFITNVANDSSTSLRYQLDSCARLYVPDLRILSLSTPGNGEITPDLRRSDHTPFWVAGYRALMITDGANFRNHNYHTAGDTLGTLNMQFMTNVVKATLATVASAAGIENSGYGISRLFTIVGANQISGKIPSEYKLYQNFPNPFNPATKIKFDIPTPLNPPFAKRGTAKPGGFVKLAIYDILGREVEVLLNEGLQPGTYTVTWDASNFPSGVYFYKLTIDDASAPLSICKKMVLIK